MCMCMVNGNLGVRIEPPGHSASVHVRGLTHFYRIFAVFFALGVGRKNSYILGWASAKKLGWASAGGFFQSLAGRFSPWLGVGRSILYARFWTMFDRFLVHFWLIFGWFLVHFSSIFHSISRFKKQAFQHQKQKRLTAKRGGGYAALLRVGEYDSIRYSN